MNFDRLILGHFNYNGKQYWLMLSNYSDSTLMESQNRHKPMGTLESFLQFHSSAPHTLFALVVQYSVVPRNHYVQALAASGTEPVQASAHAAIQAGPAPTVGPVPTVYPLLTRTHLMPFRYARYPHLGYAD